MAAVQIQIRQGASQIYPVLSLPHSCAAFYLLFYVSNSASLVRDSSFEISRSGFLIRDSPFRIPRSGFPVRDSPFRIPRSGFPVQDSPFQFLTPRSFVLQPLVPLPLVL